MATVRRPLSDDLTLVFADVVSRARPALGDHQAKRAVNEGGGTSSRPLRLVSVCVAQPRERRARMRDRGRLILGVVAEQVSARRARQIAIRIVVVTYAAGGGHLIGPVVLIGVTSALASQVAALIRDEDRFRAVAVTVAVSTSICSASGVGKLGAKASDSYSGCGGGRGIRTPEGLHLSGFQDHRHRPLGHPSGEHQ